MGGDKAEGPFFAGSLDTSQTFTLLLPTAAVTTCDFRRKSGCLERRIEDLQEIGGLLAIRLHRRVRRAEHVSQSCYQKRKEASVAATHLRSGSFKKPT